MKGLSKGRYDETFTGEDAAYQRNAMVFHWWADDGPT